MTTGIKVTKATKDISSTDIRDFILHSDYPMFKIDTVSSGSITINAGASNGTTTISHNLGYVPAFLVYENNSLFPRDIDCYATTTGITITRKLGSPYNQIEYESEQMVFEKGTENYYMIAGNIAVLGGGGGSAIRFTDISLNKNESFLSADFEWKNVLTTSGSDIKFKIWGIDQDNCSSFSSYSDANGRTKTTAVRTKTQSPNTNEFNFGDSWTSIIQEIVDRANWANGNDVGFVFNDNGTDSDKGLFMSKSYGTEKGILKITRSGSLTTNYKVVIFKDKIHS